MVFRHKLREANSTYICEIFRLDSNRPFYTNGMINQNNLRPSQQGRFGIFIERKQENVTIELRISNVQKNDENVYILTLNEGSTEKVTNFIYDGYLVVSIPPSTAECQVHFCAHRLQVCEVRCQAKLSSDGEGHICCFQNYEVAPVRHPVKRKQHTYEGRFLDVDPFTNQLLLVWQQFGERPGYLHRFSTWIYGTCVHSKSNKPNSQYQHSNGKPRSDISERTTSVTVPQGDVLNTSKYQYHNGSRTNVFTKHFIYIVIASTSFLYEWWGNTYIGIGILDMYKLM